jgi:hypothetical protein
LRSSDGSLVLLAEDNSRPTLLFGADKAGPGRLIPLPIQAQRLHLVESSKQTLWIGGVKNYRFSGRTYNYMSEAFLAHVDREGHVIWERTFGQQTQREIQSLAALPSGEVAVAGRDNESAWLARISVQGNIVWERYFGLGKGASVGTAGDRIIVTALDADEDAANKGYRENVALWTFDSAGDIVDRQIIREGINTKEGSFFAYLAVRPLNDDIYVFSAWLDMFAPKPMEVAKLDRRGHLTWRQEMPETIRRRANGSITYCRAGITILSSGDPLLACSIMQTLTLYQLHAQSGGAVQVSMPLPSCHQGSAPALFLVQRGSESVSIFGSRPGNVSAESCSWFGKAILPVRR